MKTLGIVIILCCLFVLSNVQASFTLYDTESFGGSVSATMQPQPESFSLYATLTYNGSANITAQGFNEHFEAGTILGHDQAKEAFKVVEGLINAGLAKKVISLLQ